MRPDYHKVENWARTNMKPETPVMKHRDRAARLCADLDVLTGTVIGQCLPRHRHDEFLTFLKTIDAEVPADLQIHLILDNYSTHKRSAVQRWLTRHKRFHLHFTPTSSSWLNQVERWFRELTDKNLLPRLDAVQVAAAVCHGPSLSRQGHSW